MKSIFIPLQTILALTALLAGCAGIPDSTLNALATSGGGCAKSQGIWGSILVMSVGSDKGVIRNGAVEINGECNGMAFRDAATVRQPAPKPVP